MEDKDCHCTHLAHAGKRKSYCYYYPQSLAKLHIFRVQEAMQCQHHDSSCVCSIVVTQDWVWHRRRLQLVMVLALWAAWCTCACSTGALMASEGWVLPWDSPDCLSLLYSQPHTTGMTLLHHAFHQQAACVLSASLC